MLDGGNDDRGRSQLSPDASHDASTGHAEPANAITVTDSHFRFDAAFKRADDDLRLINPDGQIGVVSGAFKSEHLSALRMPHSALSGDLVAALAGPAATGQHAAANAPHPAMPVIGRAVKIEGHVSVVRNGVAVTLNNGDVLLKGDMIQTGSDGVAGLVFKDGSVFQVGHDSRFVLTEFNYDPHGSANLEVFDLIQGSLSFASGQIAHTGDMRIGTPIAAAKITGSAGDIAVDDGATTLSIFHQDDGLHQATVLDRNGDPVGTISSDGGKLKLTSTGPSQFAADEQAKTDADKAFELDALNGILQIKNFAGHFDGSTSIGTHGSSFAPIGSNDQAPGTPSFGPDGLFGYAPLLDSAFHRAGDHAPGVPAVTAPVTFGPTNHPPTLDLQAGPAPLAALEQTPVKVLPQLTLSDADSTTLLRADVRITGNFQPGEDVLSFANTALIHGIYDPGTGVLTLHAVAGQSPTLADFQAALRTITYTDTSGTPSTLPRTLTVTVRDPDGTARGGNDLASASMILSVTAVNDAPALTLGETSLVAVEQTATVIAPRLSLSDIDSATLDHATVQITGNYLRGEDVLSFANTAHIQGRFDPASGTLTLTARTGQSPTLADFEAALRSITYTDTSDNPSPLARTLTVTVQDPNGTAHGGQDTTVHSVSLTVTPVNDPPAIIGETDPGAVPELPDAHAQSVGPITGTLSASDRDIGDTLTGHVAAPAAVSFSGGALPAGVDIDALRDVAAISFDAATTTTSGGVNTLTWTYNPAATNLDWLASGETLTITYLAAVTDGTAGFGSQPLTIIITGSNDAPTIVAAQATETVTEDVAVDPQGRLQAAGHIDFSDPDLSDTHSASVVFVSTTDSGGVALGTMSPQITTDTANGIGGQAGWSYHVDNSAAQFLAAGQSVVETYRVTIHDGQGGTATQDVSVTIVGSNDAPVIAVAETTGTVTEDSAADLQRQLHVGGTIDFTDVDPADTHTVSVDLVSSSNAGGVALGIMTPQLATETSHGLGGEVTWSYLVDNDSVQFLRAGQTVTEIHAVTVSDGHGGLATQTVTVTITGSEDAPVLAAGGSGAATEDADAGAQDIAAITGTLSVTDSDVGDTLTASIVGSPAVTLDGHAFSLPIGAASLIDNALSFQHGVATNGGAAEIGWSYDPSVANLDFLRQDQQLFLTYTVGVSDGLRDSSPQTISITITGTNDLPTITGSAADVDEAVDAHAQAISLGGGISVSDLDVGDTLTASVMGPPSVSLDGHAFTLPPGAAALIDSAALAFDNSGHLANGGATGIAWTYQPGAADLDFLKQGQTLTLTYAVVVSDGTGTSAPQNISITINGTNDAPVAVADSYTTAEDTALTIPLAGMLANDTDADGDALSAIVVTGPAHGTLALNADGSFSYTPSADYNGVDSFTYKANDGLADSHAATVSITVTPVNDPAIISGVSSGAVTEAGGVNNAAAGTPTATGTLTDTDIDNPANTFTAVGAATASDGGYGTYTMTSAGVWSYHLDDGNSAVQALNVGGTLTDTFTVTTIDGTPQLVTVIINGANDAAHVSGASSGAVTEAGGISNGTAGIPIATGTLTDSDVDSAANTFTAVGTATPSAGGYGTYTMTSAGVWSYHLDDGNSAVQALNAGATLTDTFTVTTIDGTAQVVTVTINGANDAAHVSGTSSGAVIEANGVNNGTAGAPTTTGTLTDTDIDNPANTFTAVGTATPSDGGYGTYTMTPGGVWSYHLDNGNSAVQALNAGGTLTDTFTVSTIDGTAQVVTVIINGANDAAVLSADTVNLTETNAALSTSGTLTISDVDGTATFVAQANTAGQYGTFTIASNGAWTYVASSAHDEFVGGQTYTDTFSVTSADGTTSSVTINILGSNDPASVSGTSSGVVIEASGINNGTPGTPTATGTLTDTDIDNPANTFTAVATAPSAGGYGTYTMTAAGVWTYQLDNNNPAVQALDTGATLTDTFTVTSIDGTAQVVTIVINGAHDTAAVSGTTSGAVVEAGGANNGTAGTPVATGTLTVAEGSFVAVAAATASTGGYGTYVMTSGGLWTYTLNNNNSAVQALNAGASLTDTFTIATSGGNTQVVTITIAGADDTPVISGDASAALLQGLSTTITATDLTVADLDNTASQLTFNVSSTVHGYVALSSAPGVAISSFTQVQLAAGQVIFVNDATQNPAASFTVTATDGSLTTAGVTVNVAVSSDFVITGNVDLGGVSETIHSLTQSGGTLTGTGTLTDANGATFTGGTENGSGATVVNGLATFFNAGNQTFTVDGRTLELHGSAQSGAFSGDTLHLNNGAVLKIDAGVTFTDASASGTAFNISSSAGTGTVNVAGSYEKTGGGTTAISTALTNTGTIDAKAGTLDLAGSVTNSGTLKAEGGGTLLVAGNVTGSGAVIVDSNGIVEFGGNVGAGQTITFSGSSGTLKIDHPAGFAGTITGFSGATDAIDLVGINHNSAQFAQSFNAATGILTVTDGTNTANLHFSGPTFGFSAATDGAGTGTVIRPANVYTVHNAAELNAALLAVSQGGSAAAANTSYSIELAADVSIASLGANLTAINLASGSSLVIHGAGHALDGANAYRGLFVYGGNVTIDNLAINHTLAQGGVGGVQGGGGGAGLGGGLFVAAGASVSISDVSFSGDKAIGGKGGGLGSGGNLGGGGGGMGSAGITNYGQYRHTYTSRSTSHITYIASAVDGTAGGGVGLNVPGRPNLAQGGAGGHWLNDGYRSYAGAGTGGFGGGGGGGFYSYTDNIEFTPQGNIDHIQTLGSSGGTGGFGGGGGGGSSGDRVVHSTGGTGGFGGGGGGGYSGGAGGYGGGQGGSRNGQFGSFGAGGGGLGAGGDIFVQEGGHLIVGAGSLSGGTVAGGAAGAISTPAQGGKALGSGIFIQGNQTVTFAPVSGDALTISDVIADQHGNGGTGNVEVSGAGIVHFAAANSYVGTTVVDAGATLDIDAGGGLGTGAVSDNGTLNVNAATTFASTVTDGGVLNVNAATTFAGAVTNGGVLNVNAATTFASTVTDNATLNVNAVTTFANTVTDNGALNVNAAAIFQGTVVNNGTVTINAASADFAGSITGNGTINFGTSGGTAVFEHGAPTQTITGFASGDVIDLRSVVAATAVVGANNVVTLKDAGGTVVATLHFDPAQTLGPFGVTSDGQGGTKVVAIQTTFNVSSAAELSAALTAISQGGTSCARNVSYTIHFGSDVSLAPLAASTQLAAINLDTGSSLLIDGAGFRLDGAGAHRGFFDYAGNVKIQNLTIANMLAQGGDGGAGGGGGGGGLGGGLFVGAGGSATISNVSFTGDAAHGGDGGGVGAVNSAIVSGGGGGGMSVDGTGFNPARINHHGHTGYAGGAGGGVGIANLPDGGGSGATSYRGSLPNNGGFGGGGGGAGGYFDGRASGSIGGAGGFGGGGGAAGGDITDLNTYGDGYNRAGGAGGFGGGGGGGAIRGGHFGAGGFGGGQGGTSYAYRANGAFQGKFGNVGGGGLGAGGGVFVQEGGSLTIESGSLSGGSVAGGHAGALVNNAQVMLRPTDGQALGSGIFIQGNETITFAPASGNAVTIVDAIVDQGGNGGLGAVDIKGTGTVEFDGANTYAGGTTIEAGATLLLGTGGTMGTGSVTDNGTLHFMHTTTVVNAVVDNNAIIVEGSETYTFASAISGSGTITFGTGWTTLAFNSGAPTPVVHGFGVGDVIDLKTVAATGVGSYVNGILTLTGAGGAVVGTLNFDPAQQDLISTGFRVVPDGSGGTYVVLNGIQTVFEVSTFAEFQAALKSINNGGTNSVTNTAYTINIHANLAVTDLIRAVDMASGDTLAIHGLGHSIDGAVNGVATYSGLYLRSGSLALSDLTIQNTVQHGGNGTGDPHSRNGAGGGGLGAGGGLFVGAGASATLDNVSFTGDQAIGGSGGRGYSAVPPRDTDIGRGGLFEGRYNDNNGYGGFGTGGRGSNGFIGASNGGFGAGAGGGASNFSNNPTGFHSSGQNGGMGGYAAGAGGTGQWPGFLGGGGGGGAGLGGAIFVMAGGALSVINGSLSGNNAIGGAGGYGNNSGSAGQGLGGSLFNNGSEITLTSAAGKTLNIGDSIAGTGILDLAGAGNFVFAGAISGGQTINITGAGDATLAGPITGSETINITGSGDVTLTGPMTGNEIINVAGSGDVVLSGPITGNETITYTGTGSLTLPVAHVASAGDLVTAVSDINIGGKFSIARVHTHEIDLTTDTSLIAGLPKLNLAAGDTLTVDTGGHTLDGAINGAGGGFSFAATASGGGAVLLGNAIPTFNIAGAADLPTVFGTINVGGFFSYANTSYVINLGADIPTLGSLSSSLNLAAGDTLTINTAGHTLDGAVNGNGPGFTFATGASGGTPVFTNNPVATFSVGSVADFNAALAAINPGGFFYGTNINYEIDLTADLTMNGNIPIIQLASGDTLTIKGGGHTIDGSVNGVATFSGFDLESGNLVLSHLTVEGTVAHGGNGQSVVHAYAGAGGGGLGAGGGLFIGAGASATLDGVAFTGNSAIGGSGGAGGSAGSYNGYVGAGGGGSSLSGFGRGGAGGWGHQPAFYAHSRSNGLAGGFGGGGGGGSSVYRILPRDPFWGGGDLSPGIGGGGGYGAGSGGGGGLRVQSGGGGGGAGLGGGVFVAAGGSLTIQSGSIGGNSAFGGHGGASATGAGAEGLGIGSGLFTVSQNVTLAPLQGNTLTISDTIAGGGVGVIHVTGAGNVTLSGAITGTTIDISNTGTVSLPASDLINDSVSLTGSAHFTLANKITGGGTISASGTSVLTITGNNLLTGGMLLSGSSTIDLTSMNSIGSGIITFTPNAGATLVIEAGVTVSNQINGFNPGDTIKLVGFAANATATMGANNVLTVTDGVHSVDLHLNPGLNFSQFQFDVTATSGGVMLTDRVPFAITGVVGQPVYGSGVELRGTAIPDTTVTIVANGGTTVLGTGIVDGNGNFDLITSPLADGIYTFQAVSQAGTSSQTTAGFAVTVLPSAPVITTQIGHPLNGDTVELKGTALPNQTIKLYLDGSSTVFATGVADANGNFDIVTPALIDGSHTIRATETDGLGLVSPLSGGFIVNVNPTAPTITALVNSPFNGGPIEVKGTGEPNRTIALYADDGTTMVGIGVTNASGQFDIVTSAGLSNGVHTLTAVTFNASNLFSTASSGFSVNVVPSAPAITTLVGQPDNGGSIEVKGTGQPNQTVTLYADGGATPVGTGIIDATGHFDITTTLTFADGVHRLTATATDSSNFVSPVSSQFTVNVIPDTPVISAVLPVSGTTQRIEVQGTGEVGETIKLFADGSSTVLATGTVDATGHFDIFANILGGSHTIRATETNGANLVSVISSGVSVNVTPNAPVITTLVGQPINDTTVTVKGTAQHVGGTITLYADGGTTAVGTGTVAANGTFSITTSVTFADAVHTFTATETDDGVASASSPAFTVNVNPIAPTITAQIGTTVEGGALEFVGTGEAGNTVTVKLGGATIGSGIVDATGHFDITTISGLNAGAQIVSVTETDAAHLTSTASSFLATVAPVAPAITSAVSVDDPGGRVEVFGTGKAGDIITLYADGGTSAIGSGTVDQTGHFAIYSTNGVALGAGAHVITATQALVNGAGTATSAASAASNVNVATSADHFTITSAADLAADIAAIDLTGPSSRTNAHYTFNIVGDLVLSGQLPAFNLASGDTLTIHGNGHTLDANGLPGLFVYSGALEIDNLSVINAVAKGGDSGGIFGSGGGGGGAGLGGGLFIASGGAVALDNVSFAHDRAVGGNGSYVGYAAGGGGGMGGMGNLNGGGGLGLSALGGFYAGYAPGRGIVVGAASGGGVGGADGGGGATGASAWGGGRYAYAAGGGGGIGGSAGTATAGGAGGFGGGGGGGVVSPVDLTGSAGGAGGFGGGGGGAARGAGGTGGFGGGGGAGYFGSGNAAGGFGGGRGSANYQSGGGGLGAGGAIFVQEGGSLSFGGSGGAHDNSVAGGSGSTFVGNSGSAFGSGIFLQGNQTITFAPDATHMITISDVIADMTGSHDASGQTGAGHLLLGGGGTLVLGAANTFTGGVTIENGTLDLTAHGAAGSGAISFSPADHAALEFSEANAPTNAIENFGTRDRIIIDNFHVTSESYSNGVLVLNSATGSVSLAVGGSDLHSLSDFQFAFDAGTGSTIITGGPDRSGADVIHGGPGTQILTGGTGDDVFFFRAADLTAGTTDKITDLSWATGSTEHDRIHLEGVEPNAVTVTSINGGHDTDIAIGVNGGTAHILVQGSGAGSLQLEFQNVAATSDADLNTLLTPSTANETVGQFYPGANPPYTKSLVSYGADGAVVAQDVTNNDGSHTVTVQAPNAMLTASVASDTFMFQFAAQTPANATIGNFDVAHDRLQLSQAAYADVAAAIAAISADPHNAGTPADTYIALDTLHAVTLTGVNPTQLALHDILLV